MGDGTSRPVNTTAASLFREVAACPLCASKRRSLARVEQHHFPDDPFFAPYAMEPVELERCDDCEFVYVSRVPASPAFYEHLYNTAYDFEYEFRYHGKNAIQADIEQRISKYVDHGKLLDVGAWHGAFLAKLRGRFEVHGIELNAAAAAHAQSLGLRVQQGSFADIDFEGIAPFDVVTFIDVLEHLPEPGRMLDRARGLLRPGGLLVIKVPHFEAQARKQDLLQHLSVSREGVAQNYSHINHFSIASLSKALHTRDFMVREAGGAGVEVWNLAAPSAKSVRLRRAAVNLVRAGGTAAMNALERLGLPAALNIQVFATRV